MIDAQTLAHTGAQMRRIKSQKEGLIWLQGPGPSDLWTWFEDGELKAQELTFLGLTVVHQNDRLRTGVCDEDPHSADMDQLGLLDFDPSPKGETLRAALALLKAIPASQRHRELDQLERTIALAISDI